MIAVDDAQQVLQELEPVRRSLLSRLKQLRGRVRRQLLLEGIAWAGAACAILAAMLLAIDWWFRPELTTRLLLLPLAVLAIASVVWRQLARPLWVRLDLLDLTAFLEKRERGLGNRVANVLQLPSLLEGRVQASPAMVRSAVRRESQMLGAVDFAGMLDRRRHRRFLGLLASVVLVPALFCVAAPAVARLWAARWFLASTERWPQQTYLTVLNVDQDGNVLVPRGEPAVIQVESQPEFVAGRDGWQLPGRRDGIALRRAEAPKPRVPEQVSIAYRDPVAGLKRSLLTRTGESRFRYEMPPLAEPVEIEITGGDDWLGPVRLVPIDRPAIESLELLARAPGKSVGETQRFLGAENPLLFLRSTELELRLKSRQPLAAAALVAKEAQAPRLARVDDQTYVTRWTMEQPLTLEIQMISRLGGLTSKPAYLSIGLLKDREPRVTLRSTGVGRRVTPRATIPLELRAADDFGIASVALEVERTAPAVAEAAPKTDANRIDLPLAVPPPVETPTTETDQTTKVALAEFAPATGSLVKLRGAATDQCHEGSQTGVSRWLNFQVISPEELFYDILMRQRAQRTKFAKSVQMMQEETKTLDGDVSAETVPGLLRTHQVIARGVWEVGNRLEATLVEMQLNELGTPQALELLQTKVIAPLREVHAAQLTQLRPQLEQLAAAQSPDVLAIARPLAHEGLEIMQRILAQMSQWESFVDVMNLLDEIGKLQQDVLEKTEKERKSATNDLFDE